jgi:hypothetical protein
MQSMKVYVTMNPRGKLNVRTSDPRMGDDLLERGYRDLGWGSLNWKTARTIAEWYKANKDDA